MRKEVLMKGDQFVTKTMKKNFRFFGGTKKPEKPINQENNSSSESKVLNDAKENELIHEET